MQSIHDDNVEAKVEALMMSATNGQWTEAHEEQYNQIDQQLVLAK